MYATVQVAFHACFASPHLFFERLISIGRIGKHSVGMGNVSEDLRVTTFVRMVLGTQSAPSLLEIVGGRSLHWGIPKDQNEF
jgi:hypothetical protein